MNLRDLEYLIEIANLQNFAKAAEKSHVSQPALSMQIKKLEEELGVQIFERDKKKFLITKVGAEIIIKAKETLRSVEEMKKIAQNSLDPHSGELKIGAFPTLASYFFPSAIKKISKEFPKLRLLLLEEKTDDLVEKLQNGEIDCAFLAMPINAKDLEFEKIFNEKFLLATPKNHSLSKKNIIKAADLKRQSLMLLEDGHCLRSQALEVCSMLGTYEDKAFRATSLETLRQMVIAGSGITLIPEIAIRQDDNISYLNITNSPTRNIGLYFRKGFFKKDLIIEISKILKS